MLLGLGALVATWLVACAFLFVWPPTDEPAHADALVVLAGDAEHRIALGRELVRDGAADVLVVSREPSDRWARWRRLCDEPRVRCFDADPYSTQGEAAAVAGLSVGAGWRSLVVVTSRYHVFRTRMLFRRCLEVPVRVVGADYDRRWLPVHLPLETAKLIRAVTVERSCRR